MDSLLENAREIMQLCFGFGFVIFVIFAVRAMLLATRVLKKMDDLSDLFISYIQKPLQFILEGQKIISHLLEFFKKK
jgi:hypothetical protein